MKTYSFKPFVNFSFILLGILTLSRLLFLVWQQQRIDGIEAFLTTLSNGIRTDLSLLGYFLIVPAVINMALRETKIFSVWSKILNCYLLAVLFFIIFVECATPAFIIQYDLRPNRIFVEYLIYPKEVFGMLIQGHLLTLILTTITTTIIIGFVFINRKNLFNIEHKPVYCKWKFNLLSVVMICVLFLCARGTLEHRPLNPSLVYFSNDPLINSLTLNSTYSIGFALYQMQHEKNSSEMYGTMSKVEIFSEISLASELSNSAQLTQKENFQTLMTRTPFHQGKPKNIVIVLEESLGAKFVGSLGGKSISPNLEQLLDSGWSFDNLYATGTRSVRGIEAVITGFTPTPARSVVKLDKSQTNFYTIAETLKSKNYQTQFIYGGQSHFDNMKSFFLGNGFTNIVDLNNFENPKFVGSWGASDGDLFDQSIKELNKLNDDNQPFFSLIFTSSNHSPFEIPPNVLSEKIGESKQDKAIRYADYALGKFIDQSKQEAYWENTIFLIVADHESRTVGNDLVPLNDFHIPAVFLNSKMPNIRDKRLVSQIDLPVTLLSLAGINEPTPMLGFDLTKTQKNQRAMMQYYDNFAYVEDRAVAILQPNKPISYWNWDKENKTMQPSKDIHSLGKRALAFSLFGSLAYDQSLYNTQE